MTFYQISEETFNIISQAKFTASEYKIWHYFVIKDPFGDRWSNLPTIKDLIEILEVSKATFYRAIAKFSEFKLFDFRGQMQCRNLRPSVSKMRQQSQEKNDSQDNETAVSKMRQQSQKCKKQSLETLPVKDYSSSQTNKTNNTFSYVSNNTHTDSDVLQEKILNSQSVNSDESTELPTEKELKNEYQPEKGKVKSSEGCNTLESRSTLSRTQSINWQWLPEGVWNIDSKLDPAFQEWLAKRWMAKFDDIADIHEAKANVLAYFRNDPAKLPIKWEEYQNHYLSKGQNIKTRIENGCRINDEEKQDFVTRASALKPLDYSQCVSASKTAVSKTAVNIYSNNDQKEIEAVNKEETKPTYYTEPETGEKYLNENNQKYEDVTGLHDRIEQEEKITYSTQTKNKWEELGKKLRNKSKGKGFGGRKNG